MQAYYRKAQAFREKLDEDQCLELLKKAIEVDDSNEEIIKYFEEAKREYEEDHNVASDHPEKIRWLTVLEWLKNGGSKYDKLKLRFYSPDYRGVHAARDIKKGETILYIPKK